MPKPPKPTPSADLHTPDELLAAADSLLVSGDPLVRRAAVLEAITALEAFVHKTVFGLLERTYDPLLVTWLKSRTQSDFETRLFVLTPVALGRPVDKASALWKDYTEAKSIRNKVTHTGKKVSEAEAAFVLATVRSWLSYLGSTAEVALALDGLKTFVESEGIVIADEAAAERVVHEYFERTSPAIVAQPRMGDGRRPDLLLDYGGQSVVVEVKLIRNGIQDLEAWITQAVDQVGGYVRALGASRGAVVIFSRTPPTEAYRAARVTDDAKISVVVIEATG